MRLRSGQGPGAFVGAPGWFVHAVTWDRGSGTLIPRRRSLRGTRTTSCVSGRGRGVDLEPDDGSFSAGDGIVAPRAGEGVEKEKPAAVLVVVRGLARYGGAAAFVGDLDAQARRARQQRHPDDARGASVLEGVGRGLGGEELQRVHRVGGRVRGGKVRQPFAGSGRHLRLRLAILRLAEEVRTGLRGWWAALGDILSGSYAECENVAEEILSYQPAYFPGLFQTSGYARAIMRAEGVTGEELERRVQTRMARQILMAREQPPHIRVLLEETALRLDIGDRDVMDEQLEALLAAAKRPNIELRVIEQGSSVRIHPGRHGGTFVIFGFGGPVDMGVVYLETIAGGHYLEELTQVQRCRLLFGRMAETALSEDDSAAFISALIKERGQ